MSTRQKARCNNGRQPKSPIKHICYPVTRVIIHAGFHKTGTTTAQQFLMQNGKHIWPHHAIAIQHRIQVPLHYALTYSTGAGVSALEGFRKSFSDFLKTLGLGGRRGLIISAENLAGMMPGKNPLVDGYSSCPTLMKTVAECIEDIIDPNPDMSFHFSTRGRDDWLRSLWWHNLSKTRLTQDLSSFSTNLGASCDLEETVAQVQKSVAPYAVTSMALEHTANQRFGPATPLIDLLELPKAAQDKLETLPAQNVMPPRDLVQQFLALNRSNLSTDNLALRKQELLAQNRNLD